MTAAVAGYAARASVAPAVVLATMVAAGWSPPWAAAIGFAVIVLAAAFWAAHYHRALAAAGASAARLARLGAADSGERVPPAPTAQDLGSALRRIERNLARRTDEALTRAAADELIIDALPDPMLVLDDRLRVVRVNTAARKLFGRELRGRDLSAVLRHPQVLEAAQESLTAGEEKEVEFTLSENVARAVNARTKPLVERPSDGSALVLTLHDLTEVKRADRMRADFVANASHELRTPLAAIAGFIETLRGPAAADADARARFLAIMQEQSNRMTRLIDDLLSLSRIELNEHSAPTARIDIGLIVRRTIASLEMKAAGRDMTVEVSVPDKPVMVVGDADQIEQVVQNLVDNAIKYGRAGSTIEIAVKAGSQGFETKVGRAGEAGMASIRIHNEGEAIPPEHLPRLTERFYRVDAARSRQLGGTGLGLAIVKHIVNRHRGALNMESATGRGATFTVRLPAAEDPEKR